MLASGLPAADAVRITAAAYRDLLACCSATLPNEACGVLSRTARTRGSAPAAGGMPPIAAVHPVANAAAHPASAFAFDPQSWIEVCLAIHKNRHTIAGFFHSHPLAGPLPSRSDADGWPGGANASYWIVSLSEPDRPQTRAFLPVPGPNGSSMFAQVSIEIV